MNEKFGSMVGSAVGKDVPPSSVPVAIPLPVGKLISAVVSPALLMLKEAASGEGTTVVGEDSGLFGALTTAETIAGPIVVGGAPALVASVPVVAPVRTIGAVIPGLSTLVCGVVVPVVGTIGVSGAVVVPGTGLCHSLC
jgi:hypothetical protein